MGMKKQLLVGMLGGWLMCSPFLWAVGPEEYTRHLHAARESARHMLEYLPRMSDHSDVQNLVLPLAHDGWRFAKARFDEEKKWLAEAFRQNPEVAQKALRAFLRSAVGRDSRELFADLLAKKTKIPAGVADAVAQKNATPVVVMVSESAASVSMPDSISGSSASPGLKAVSKSRIPLVDKPPAPEKPALPEKPAVSEKAVDGVFPHIRMFARFLHETMESREKDEAVIAPAREAGDEKKVAALQRRQTERLLLRLDQLEPDLSELKTLKQKIHQAATTEMELWPDIEKAIAAGNFDEVFALKKKIAAEREVLQEAETLLTGLVQSRFGEQQTKQILSLLETGH
jgi:hypothetical protein